MFQPRAAAPLGPGGPLAPPLFKSWGPARARGGQGSGGARGGQRMEIRGGQGGPAKNGDDLFFFFLLINLIWKGNFEKRSTFF